MNFTLDSINEYVENNKLELKKASGGIPNSLWETYSAFANSEGGTIILGVEEIKNGEFQISGLNNVSKLIDDFWNTINNPSKVSFNLLDDSDLILQERNNKTILIIKVPEANRELKPIYINNDLFKGTYKRIGSGDYHCSRNEIISMLRDETETSDSKILMNLNLSALNRDSIKHYRNRHHAYRPQHVWEDLEDEEYLERIEAIKWVDKDQQYHPTVAGLLMFGEEYLISGEFPEYFLDYRELLDPTIRWLDRVQSSSGDWTGNLFDFYFKIYYKLIKDLKIPFKLEGMTRIEDTSVHKALREALVNCIVNADFFIPRGIVIKKDFDSIILENPGDIRIGKEQMLHGGISDPRNKKIMKMFNLIGIGERAGSGVPNIFSTWEDQNWKEPIIEEQSNPNRTILKLSFQQKNVEKKRGEKTWRKSVEKKRGENKKSNAKKTLDNKDKILSFLNENGISTTKDLAHYLGLSPERTRIILKELINEDKIIRTGNGKSTFYNSL